VFSALPALPLRKINFFKNSLFSMAQVAPFNKGRINPIYKAGAVNVNAKLSEHDMAARMRRVVKATHPGVPQPYFAPPIGVYSRSFATCEIGEFAFRNRDYTDQEMDKSNSNAPAAFDSNISVAVMTTLNLLGEAVAPGQKTYSDADAREAIAVKLQIFGVVVADNRDNNESNLTLMVDGVFTAVNNGSHAIPPGWVIATVPSASDVDKRQGGRDVIEEKEGGRVTLRLEPYDASIHKHTPQRAYACWKLWSSDMERAKEMYLHSYILLSMHLMSSVLGIAAITISALKKANFINTDDAEIAKILSALTPTNRGGSNIQNKIIDAVFVAYGDARHTLGQVDAATKQRAGAIGEYMYSVGEHVRVVLERVVGRALTGAIPGDDMDIILMQPSR
jgi:hypothetical protein